MPKACSYYTNFADWTFKVAFSSSMGMDYLRVPLATFAQTRLLGGGV
jgi:hypothetical protein